LYVQRERERKDADEVMMRGGRLRGKEGDRGEEGELIGEGREAEKKKEKEERRVKGRRELNKEETCIKKRVELRTRGLTERRRRRDGTT
jgi:hypothetical protein